MPLPDVFSPKKRSWIMSQVRNADTEPELALRRALWLCGVRGWRVRPRSVMGKPDVVFPRGRLAVFVDGGFWHGHPRRFRFGLSGAFWDKKIAGNIARDRKTRAKLRRAGWSVIRLWDFDVRRSPERAADRVRSKLLSLRART